MISQTVFDTSRVLELKGVRHVVLSPGSRNAPLTISFARNPNIKIYNIVDERSAGFIALGICQKQKEPVAICCTSGTSLLNYAPAVAEAFYQELPLIVLSADRPAEWLDQRDGQTINQPGAISNFVKKTYQLPADTSHVDGAWDYNKKLNEAINLSLSGVKGPVHINIPFREPFYPKADDELKFSDQPRIITSTATASNFDLNNLAEQFSKYSKRLVVCGQDYFSSHINQLLSQLENTVVVADVISNVEGEAIRHHDLFLQGISEDVAKSLQPDLLITMGKSVISKSLKLFLRKYPAQEHWHINENGAAADTFQQLTKIVTSSSTAFLAAVDDSKSENDFDIQVAKNYVQGWHILDKNTSRKLSTSIAKSDFCEYQAYDQVLQNLPADIDLHLANSMPVRFANFLQNLKSNTEVFCNRGTSGIDGTNGTAVGNSLVSDNATWLLTGDLSFFYDRNAFFHPHDLSNLKIVVFNNSGGGIFRLIPGPSALPELVQHFETRHQHSAKFTAAEYGFDYYVAHDLIGIEKAMDQMKANNKSPQLLEIFTDPEINSTVYQAIKSALKD